jgi:anti-sigma factor (TIGR02949 family)
MQKKWGIRKIAETMGFKKKSKHNCDATLQKVMLALDNEMSEEDEKKLLEEINNCSYCLEKFQIEQAFKKYLCDKVKRHSCSPSLANQIRNEIHNSMDR